MSEDETARPSEEQEVLDQVAENRGQELILADAERRNLI